MRKILAIDGGGIKGTFPAAFLATVEDTIEDNLANYFDLIVGTSTGGIIALGIGLGLSTKELLAFYEKHGPTIFKGNRALRLLRWLGTSKYSNAPLENALRSCFGDKRLGNSKKRLVIPSLNLETGEVYIYKTAHHPRLERDYKEDAVEVALKTAAAPTYFPTHRSSAGTPFIDGGMWANNPIGMAVVEAVTLLDWPRDSLKVLSLGCTTEPLNVNWGRNIALGGLYWATKCVDVFMHAQSHASFGTAKLLAGYENIRRINPTVARGKFDLDKASEISSLKGLGEFEARKALPELREIFFNDRAEQFVPCHTL